MLKHDNKIDNNETSPSPPRCFREVPVASQATSLTDGVRLATPHNNNNNSPHSKVIVMPWLGFGTYRLGKDRVEGATMEALKCGYRAIDTAYIYGGETTEAAVGSAIQKAISSKILMDRSELFVTTKHWRKYHGYEPSLQCLDLSLKRLQLDYVDLWLMHWPGPAWETINRRKDLIEQDPWYYAVHSAKEMARLRAETWRAMEDSCRLGQVKAIGVSNMTVGHLKTLKQTATLWPPAVNQVELHPLYPQTDLLDYCQREGIVVQAYASLGGQDTSKAAWKKLLGEASFAKSSKSDRKVDLLHAEPVVELATRLHVTPAQVLLRWGLERGCSLIPKTSTRQRLVENAGVLNITLSQDQVEKLQKELFQRVAATHPDQQDLMTLTRLCWRSDPLRLLDLTESTAVGFNWLN